MTINVTLRYLYGYRKVNRVLRIANRLRINFSRYATTENILHLLPLTYAATG
jgi:hypothetical protein